MTIRKYLGAALIAGGVASIGMSTALAGNQSNNISNDPDWCFRVFQQNPGQPPTGTCSITGGTDVQVEGDKCYCMYVSMNWMQVGHLSSSDTLCPEIPSVDCATLVDPDEEEEN